MATSGRRPRIGRQYAFSLRNLSVCFGLIALVVFAVGVAVSAADGATDAQPAAAVAVGLLTLLAAVVMRHRRMAPASPEEDSLGAADFEAMTASEFEQAVADLCERDGCQVSRVEGGAGDLGADARLTSARKALSVGIAALRQRRHVRSRARARSAQARESVTGLSLSLNGIPGGRWCELLLGGCG